MDKVLELLQSKWLINMDVVKSYVPLFISYLNGSNINIEKLASDDLNFIEKQMKEYLLQKKCSFKSEQINVIDPYNDDFNDLNLPDNTVAIVPIQGVVYSWMTKRIVNWIHTAESNEKITSILLYVNTPGGMVYYTDIASDIIKNSKIPVVGYVENMCASAGMWLISGVDKIFISSKLDVMGSIGVMTSYMDSDGFFKEKLGIDIYDIYARLSSRKNESVRMIKDKSLDFDKKISLVQDDLDYTNSIFHETIINNRGIDKDSEVLSGVVYYAEKAIEMGLADEMGSIENAISYALQIGAKNRIKSLFNN